MKRILFIHVMALFCAVQSYAQNSLNSGDFSTGSWGTGQAMSASAGTSLIITKGVTTTGDKYFRFFGDGSPCGEYQPNTNGDFFTHNVAVTAPNANCGSANAWRVNVPTTTSNVVFKTDGGNDGIDRSIVYVIQGTVQSVSSVAQSPVAANVFPGQAVTVTATLSGAFATGQAAYLRYTTDGFTTSTVVTMTGSGTSYTATIPAAANTPSASLSYYVFTSGNTAPAANGSDADFATINLNNNGGSNYTYTVAAGWTTAAAGNWGTAGTWTANAIPPTASNLGVVTINHSVTQNTAAIASSVVINAAGTLTGTANTLTISNNTSGTTFTNSGTMTLSGTHAVTFAGTATHTISGTTTFNNVNTTTGVNFGASSTVNGVFTLNAGGFVSTNAPTYGASSTLTYNTGAAYAASTEWTANALTGQGVPQNVTISTASTSVNFGSSAQYRRLRGNLTISASTTLALSTAAGGDLRIGGNWNNNGTFTANSRAVYFDGSTAQSILAGGTSFAFLFISNTSADVTSSTNITVSSNLTVDVGARLNTTSTTLNITGTTSTINGFLRIAGPVTGASTTTLTFSSTGVYEHNFTTIVGVIPTATWSTGSTCRIMGYTSFGGPMTSANGWGQTFHHFDWACGNQASTCNWQMNATTPPTILGNFSVSNSNTAAAGLRLASSGTYTLNISGNFSVAAASALNTARLDLSNGSAGIINLSGNMTVNNVGTNLLSVGTGSAVINFIGSTAQSVTVPTPGNITGGVSFRLNNAAGLSIPTGSTLPINAAATFFRTNGSVTLAGTGVIAYGATNSTLNYDGTGAITTQDAEFPSASGPTNLTINNAGGVSLHAARALTGTAGVLTLTSGRLSLGSNNLTVPNTASAAIAGTFSSTAMVVADGSGRLLRGIATAALPITYTWPIGEATGTAEYSPVSLTFSANSTARNIGFNVVDGNHPQLDNPDVQTNYVSRYWISSNSAAGTYSYTGTFTYLPADINGTEGSMRVNMWNGSAWAQPISAAASNVLTISSSVTETTLPLGATAEFTGRVRPASTYAWVATTGSADWQAAASWSPSRTVLGPDDILSFPNGGSSTATNVPSQTLGKLLMSNNTSVTLVPSASNNTLTLTGGAGSDIDIASGCSMTVGQTTGNSLSLTYLGTGHVASIAGTYSIPQNATNVHDYNTTNATSTVTGTFNMGGTITGATTTTLTFAAGSTYNHSRNGGTVPTSTWNATSTLSVTGVTTTVPSAMAQSIGNWVWNCAGQSAELAILNTNMPSAIATSWTISGTNGQILAFSAVSKNYGTANWTITGNSTVYLLRSGATTTDITVNNLDITTTSALGLHLNTGSGTFPTASLRINGNLTINSSSTTAINWGNTSGNLSSIFLRGNFTQTAGALLAGTTATNRLRFVNTGVKNYSASTTIALTEILVEGGTLDLGSSGLAITAPVAVSAGATLKLGSGNVTSNVGNVTLAVGSNIEFASTGVLNNTGNFATVLNSTLTTVNPDGIATTGATGCVQNSGTRSFATTASYVYNGTSAQVTGAGFTGASNLTINNSAGVTLSATVTTITGTLALTSGKLSLGSFDLTLPSTATVSGASSTNYVATTGTGRLRRSTLTTAFTFPVGNSSYNPITITNTGTSDTYGVIVADGSVPAATVASACVDRRWIITEGTAGGGNLSVTAQYNSGEAGGTFTTASQVYVGLYIPTTWTTATTTVNGTNPFTAAASGFNQSLPTSGTTAYFAIGNEAMSLAAPTVSTTVTASSITNDSASSGGQGITGSSLSAKGVVYSTAAVSTSPTLSNSVLTDGGTTSANFTSNLTGLDPETQYYVRAYVTNAAGTGYGPAINFRTLSNPATAQASGLSASVTASGELTISWTGATFPSSGATQGGYALIYSTSTPTLSSSNGNTPAAGVGTLITITPTNLPTAPATSYVMSGLTGGTAYNFLLVPFTWDGTNATTYNYVTASAPTASATVVTNPAITTTTAITSITNSSASSGGSGISANGGTISAKGVVWNTATAPTTANNSTTDGTGTASFSSSLTSLNAQTLYYVRSYATNDVGTAYGNELTFYTLSNEPTAAATAFSATENGSSQIDLAWTAATFPGTGATNDGYIILRRIDSADPTTSGITDGVAPGSLSLPTGTTLVTTITSGTTASYNHTGLSASTQYNYLIVPFTWNGSNAATYNYYVTSAPNANATTSAGLPTVDITVAASSITNSSASSGGNDVIAGGSAITAKGVAYNTTGTPTTADNTTSDGSGTANFTSSLTGLSGQTLYYVRAYVTNSSGTGYGNEINFRTLSNPATAQASGLSATASAAGELTINWTGATFPSSDATQGGYALIYSTATPSLSSANATAPAAGTGTLITITPTNLPTSPATSYVLSGLTAGTTYNFLLVPFTWDGTNTTTYHYLASSAPTLSATAVGNPSISTTTAISSITESSASSGGSGIVANGGTISAKGVVWNTASSPTTANNSTNDGTGTAGYTSAMSGLSAQTLYYVRSYATNDIGTAYGNEITFRTLSNPATAQASGLSATASASGELTINWTGATFPSSGATEGGYALIYSTATPTLSSANGNAPAAGVGTLITITPTNLPTAPSTSYVLSGLTGGTTYNFLLVPFTWNGSNTTTYNYLTSSAPTTAGTAVTTASVTTTTISSITASTANSGGSSISAGGGSISAKGVVWNTATAPTLANSSTSNGTGTTAYTSNLTSLNGETLYYVRAYVTNELGTAYGNELTFRTLSNAPTAQAAGLSATATSSSNINLTWTAATFPGTGATVTGYVLLRATSPNTPSLANGNGAAPTAGANTTIVSSSISGAATSASSSGLAAITAYNYLLVPFTWDGVNTSTYNYLTTSAPIANATTFASLPIAQPTSLTHSAVTATTITTSWTAAAGGPSGYIVLRSTGSAPDTDPVSGTTYTAGNALGNATVVYVGAAVTTGAQTGLVDGTTYFYEVFSYNGTGSTRNYLTTSPLSGSQATTAVSAPTATAGTSVTDNSFTANWNSVTGAASYQLDVFPLTYDSFDNATTLFAVTSGTGTYYTGNSAAGDAPATTTFVSNGTHSFGKSNGSVSVTSTNINTTALASPQLSFKLASFSITSTTNGADGTDIVTVEISADGGNTYNSAVRVLGNTNARWSFTSGTGVASTAYDGDATPVDFTPAAGGARTTDGYSTVTVTGLPSTTNLRVRITLVNNAVNERWLIDNFTISPAPSNISGYNSLSVSGTSQTVTGLASNTTYGYVVRAVGTNTTSGNSNTIAVTTLVGQSDADYRTIASGNFSTLSNWEYNDGTSWVTATQAPGANNNTTVQAAHSITMDVAYSMNTGKTMTVNGALSTGTFVISGGTFTLASGATLTVGSADGIASTGATGNIQTTTRTFNAAANYIFAGAAAQITGTALPTTITGSLAIQSGANTVTLTNAPTTTDSLSLQSGLFAIGSGATLNISANGKVVAASGDFATGAAAGTINFVGLGSFSGNCNPYNVYANNGVNFGSGTVTIQNGGTFRINSGGYIDTNAPFYGAGSTLQYNVGATYGRNLEWSASAGRGYPHHVTISNNTTLNPAGTAGANASVALQTGGNLTIDSGASLYMDFGGNNMTVDLVVLGDLTMNGNFSGSGASGSDIFVGGNWTNNGTTANFFPNSRAVFLNGTGTQTIAGTNASFPVFPYLFIDKTAGSVVLSRDVQVSTQFVLSSSNVANISAGSFTLNVSGTATTALDRQGSGHIIGNLRRGIGTGTNSYAYPIGDASNYTPVSLDFNNVTGAGNVTLRSTAAEQSQIGSSGLDSTLSVNRYFTATNNATTFTSYTATLNFVSGGRDAGITTNDLLVGLYNSTWSYPTVGTITATSIQASGVASFGDFVIAECKSPAIYTVTGGGEYCSGSGGVDVSISDSELGVSYQLKRDGVNVGSAVAGTGNTLSFGNQTATGLYSVIANSLATSGCNNPMTDSVLVNVNSVVTPALTISASATTFCDGTSVTFTATPQFGGSTPSYQWKVNGSNAGTDSTTFSTSTLVDGDVVTCVLTSSEECPSPATATSNSIEVSVVSFEAPSISISISSGTTICSGDLITVTSTPLFGGGLPTFDWLVNGVSTGEADSTFSTFSLNNGDQVSCIFTSNFLCTTVGADTSNTLTFTVVTPPQVDAGTNMTTCGTTAFTFANGATNNNTTSIAWTENGAGSITSGANTLTPTYTPAAGDLGTTVTFTLTGYGNSPCAEIADNVTLQIDALTLYYDDDDSDGFGDPLSSPVASCTPISGKASNNTDCCDTNADINPMSEWWADADGDGVGGFIFTTGCVSGCSGFASTIPYYPGAHGGAPYGIDCNDGSSTAYPGATELCGNAVDDDCDQTIDEGCSGIINDGFANATLLNVNTSSAYYPNCQNNNGSVLNADISAEGNPANVASGAGRDSWYRFVAPSSAARIQVVPTGFDAVVELRTAAHPAGQVDVENANATVGGTEIMNVSGLTIGQTYYVAVRNYDATAGGTFTICVSPLMPSGCGTSQPTGGFSLCSTFKGVYRGATNYTFNFTGTGGTAPTPFATTSVTVTNAVITLSNATLALRNGGIYNIRVDANYTLLNGAGIADPTITILGPTTNCLNRTIAAAPQLEVRSSQRCPATLFRSTYLAAVPITGNGNACGAVAYNYRFTRVTDCTGATAIGGSFVVTTPNASPFLSLYAAFPNTTYPLPNLGYWKVEVAPVFSYGATAYGPARVIQVNNTAASTMLPEEAIAAERSETMDTNIELYPNPGSGDRVFITAESEMPITQWAIFDELGRKVEGYQVIPLDGIHYELVFNNTLAGGLYHITWLADGEPHNTKWIVSGQE